MQKGLILQPIIHERCRSTSQISLTFNTVEMSHIYSEEKDREYHFSHLLACSLLHNYVPIKGSSCLDKSINIWVSIFVKFWQNPASIDEEEQNKKLWLKELNPGPLDHHANDLLIELIQYLVTSLKLMILEMIKMWSGVWNKARFRNLLPNTNLPTTILLFSVNAGRTVPEFHRNRQIINKLNYICYFDKFYIWVSCFLIS